MAPLGVSTPAGKMPVIVSPCGQDKDNGPRQGRWSPVCDHGGHIGYTSNIRAKFWFHALPAVLDRLCERASASLPNSYPGTGVSRTGEYRSSRNIQPTGDPNGPVVMKVALMETDMYCGYSSELSLQIIQYIMRCEAIERGRFAEQRQGDWHQNKLTSEQVSGYAWRTGSTSMFTGVGSWRITALRPIVSWFAHPNRGRQRDDSGRDEADGRQVDGAEADALGRRPFARGGVVDGRRGQVGSHGERPGWEHQRHRHAICTARKDVSSSQSRFMPCTDMAALSNRTESLSATAPYCGCYGARTQGCTRALSDCCLLVAAHC